MQRDGAQTRTALRLSITPKDFRTSRWQLAYKITPISKASERRPNGRNWPATSIYGPASLTRSAGMRTCREVVEPQTSNAASVVNVKGDPDSNCLNLSLELPPAKQICTDVPRPTFSAPEDKRQVCTIIPRTLVFTVTYQSRVDVDKVLGDTIYQIENLMASASSGCSGGAHGVPPVNWSGLQSRGNAALIALSDRTVSRRQRTGLARRG
jgi:hypothetical protein